MKRAHLGEFEELVLLAVASLHGSAYGLEVQRVLVDEARRSVALATVHSALYRLERKGYVQSELGGATQQRGGRRKRLFAITGAGLSTLADARAVREHLWQRVQGFQPTG